MRSAWRKPAAGFVLSAFLYRSVVSRIAVALLPTCLLSFLSDSKGKNYEVKQSDSSKA